MPIECKLPQAPTRLPRPDEIPDFGCFRGRTGDVDTSAWDQGLRRRFQRKTWTYAGVFSERCYVGLAIVDAGYLATAFVYVYDRETKRFIEHKATKPFGFASSWQPDLNTVWALSSGQNQWEIAPSPQGWVVSFSAKNLDLRIELEDLPCGMSTLAPAQARPFHYTHKLAAMPARLQLTVGDTQISEQTLGVMDFSKGYPPRHMYWNWASFVGATDEGAPFGVNLVADFNNGLENGAWVAGELIPLSQALFRYDRKRIEAPWEIRTLDGSAVFTFFPEGVRAENLTVGLMASRFAQPFGRFEGHVVSPGGKRHAVAGHGVVEQHLAVW